MSAQLTQASVDAGARLDRLPMSAWHYRLLALITAGVFVDTFELYSGGSVLAALVQSGWSTLEVNATFISVTFVGLTAGAWLAGLIGDRYGRRFCYQLNLAVFGVASLAAVFAPSMNVLIALRFFMGLGLGAEIVVGYATLAEFLPARNRGRWMGLMVLLGNSSSLVALLTAYLVVPNFGWRAMFFLPGVAALVIWLARRALPESPRWLESVGRTAEADEILLRVEREVARQHPLPDYIRGHAASTDRVPYATLFARGVIGRTLTGMLMTCTTGFTLYGLLQWLPSFYVKQGMSFSSSLLLPAIMSAGILTGAAIAMVVADRYGRKRSIAVSSVLAVLLSLSFVLSSGTLFLLAAYLLAISLGTASTVSVNIYLSELFETRYRLRGVGLCGSVGRLATAAMQFIVVIAYAWGGVPAIVGLLAVLLATQAVVIQAFGVETRQVSLETVADLAATPELLGGVAET